MNLSSQNKTFHHVPIMKLEVLNFLACDENKNYADLTLGGGGHAEAILNKTSPNGILIGVDRDAEAISFSEDRLSVFGERVRLYHQTMADAVKQIELFGFDRLDGVLIDCGVSSHQLDRAERGFSYMHEGPIDMRMGSVGMTAKELIESEDEEDLANIIYNYADERLSRRIAKALKRGIQSVHSTLELKELVESAIPRAVSYKNKKDSVSRTFQALRMAVNSELEQLEKTLDYLLSNMKEGSRIVVMTFHSIEDRLVKKIFRACEQKKGLRRLNKRVCIATDEEIVQNSRSRSAKLRAVEIAKRDES